MFVDDTSVLIVDEKLESLSDVTRPLSYKTKIKTTYVCKIKTGQAKTKTTFSTPRPLF